MRLSVEDLRAFVLAVDHGSVGRAAQVLHVGQPALSKRLKHLEDMAGLTLLERSATGVTPTAAGGELLADARRVLAQVDALASRIASLRVTPELVRVASTPALAERVVPAAIALLDVGETSLPVELLVANSARVHRVFADARTDVAILATDPDADLSGSGEPLSDDVLVAVVGPDDPWAELDAVTAEMLAERRLALRDPASHVRRTLERAMGEAGLTLARPLMEAGNPAAVKATVRGRGAAGVLSIHAVDPHEGLVTVPISGLDLRRRYWVLVSPDASSGAAQLVQRLKESFAR